MPEACRSESVKQQVDLIREELAGKSTLLPGGLIKKSELLALQRAEANLIGEIGRLGGDVGDAKARIARTEKRSRAYAPLRSRTRSSSCTRSAPNLPTCASACARLEGVLEQD